MVVHRDGEGRGPATSFALVAAAYEDRLLDLGFRAGPRRLTLTP